MSLEQEAWKLNEVRRRAAGQRRPGARAPAEVTRGPLAWVALLLLVAALAASAWVMLGVAVRAGASTGGVMGLASLGIGALVVALAASRDQARRLRGELAQAVEEAEALEALAAATADAEADETNKTE